LLLLSFAALAGACLWDYDTLSMEAKKMPDVVDAIVGRFERNPPLYYQMRLERVSKEIESTPEELDLYDDAAVACDRLGDDDTGLQWLERKRKVLDKLDPDRKQSDDWYRYYANLGTLRVHRWAKDGMKKEEIKELEQAIGEIEKAIEINPDAHFGREWAQLAFMKAIQVKLEGTEDQLEEAIRGIYQYDEPEKVQKALVGLIVLGAAWESPDMYLALASFPLSMYDASISRILELRTQELIDSGRTYVFGPDAPVYFNAFSSGGGIGQSKESLERAYGELRKNAEEYNRNRTEFMLSRLREGQHPDTDPTFWNGYVETPRVDLRQFEPLIPQRWYLSHEGKLVGVVTVLSLPVVGLFIYSKRKRILRERRERAQARANAEATRQPDA
jgi:tetratricopeptide (TPR) repeat protein